VLVSWRNDCNKSVISLELFITIHPKGEEFIMTKFECIKTREPDFAGCNFYVGYGREFDEETYEKACGIKPPKEVCRQIQKAVDDLQHDEWLEIIHGEPI
jgi:hypothetical protein